MITEQDKNELRAIIWPILDAGEHRRVMHDEVRQIINEWQPRRQPETGPDQGAG